MRETDGGFSKGSASLRSVSIAIQIAYRPMTSMVIFSNLRLEKHRFQPRRWGKA